MTLHEQVRCRGTLQYIGAECNTSPDSSISGHVGRFTQLQTNLYVRRLSDLVLRPAA